MLESLTTITASRLAAQVWGLSMGLEAHEKTQYEADVEDGSGVRWCVDIDRDGGQHSGHGDDIGRSGNDHWSDGDNVRVGESDRKMLCFDQEKRRHP